MSITSSLESHLSQELMILCVRLHTYSVLLLPRVFSLIKTIAPSLVEFRLALLINDFRRPGIGHQAGIGRSCCSNIQESNVMCVVLDKSFSAFDVFSHQDTENVVGY